MRVRVFSRPGCHACIYFQSVIRPLLEQKFGDLLILEEIDVTQTAWKIATPSILVEGAHGRRALYDSIRLAVMEALKWENVSLRDLGGLWLASNYY